MQVRLESQSQQTNVTILTPASTPVTPSKPRVILNLLVGVISGAFLGLGLAYFLELNNRRVRSPGDLASITHLQVLSKIPSAKPPTAIQRLLRNFRTAANITSNLMLGQRP